jgi:hypothetical protein
VEEQLAGREQALERRAALVEHAGAVVDAQAFILPNLPALSGRRRERAGAGAED